MKKILVIPLLAALLCGCATSPVAEKLPTSQIYAAPKDKVWPLVVSEVGLQYPVKAIEKESGLLTTDFVNLDAGYDNGEMGRWVFPPREFLATWNGLRVTLSVLVVELEPGKTQVSIQTHYEAFENNVQHAWIVCDSNGSLENGILTQIAQKLSTP